MASVTGNSAAMASVVFRPLPVMETTVVSPDRMRPSRISFWVTPAVTPPAVSVKMPSVSARSLMAATISGSETSCPTAAFEDLLGGVVAVGGVADGERAGDGVGLLRLEPIEAALDGGGDRRATRRLGAEEFHLLGLDPT